MGMWEKLMAGHTGQDTHTGEDTQVKTHTQVRTHRSGHTGAMYSTQGPGTCFKL